MVEDAYMIGKLRRRYDLYRQRGLLRSLKGERDIAILSVFCLVFGFPRWHAQSPTSLRSYRIGLAAMINAVRPQFVIEVGCGLGAILARVEARQRIGYDVDSRVIRAARFLRSRAIHFRTGGFEAVSDPVIDVLVAVNWPHDFSAEQLEHWLMPLLTRTRYLLLDRIQSSSPTPYHHYHDFAFLSGYAKPIRIETLPENHPPFILFEVMH